ncbi:MAG: 3-dehydroquinate synthase [Clostridia bacterium]|nr:3-dehydroquinate synthase [Clostridia bacterium]
MTTVKVAASLPYDVLIEKGLLDASGELISKTLPGSRAAVVTDSAVAPLYLDRLCSSLDRAGVGHCEYVFPRGEQSKTMATLEAILDFCAANRLTRSDCVIALGGGVTGDTAGFASAVYLRGIPFIQIPTTLLAMVDSSVGGKTAVDLPSGKNLAGAFHHPSLVICDPALLDTLDDANFACGAAEAIKAGMIGDAELFGLFKRTSADPRPDEKTVHEIIERSIRLKARTVEADEFDKGERMKLNFGHTVGHAIEKCSGYSLGHGQCVAAGMMIMSRAAEKLGWTLRPVCGELREVLEKFSLPTGTDIAPEELLAVIESDKKRRGDTVNIVVPREIGSCVIRKTDLAGIKEILREALI